MEKNEVTYSRSLLNSIWNKHKDIHIKTHHGQKVESQNQKENCESSKRKMTCQGLGITPIKPTVDLFKTKEAGRQ